MLNKISNTNCQNFDSPYLIVYINDFVKKFRFYNKDKFLIIISGLNKFINEDDEVIDYLIKQLEECNFKLEFEGNEENIAQFQISCKNLTTDISRRYTYNIQNLPSIIELSSITDIPIVGIILMIIVGQIISSLKILYKALILDLDDTLWIGALSEVGIEKIKKGLQSEKAVEFIEFMKFVKVLGNELGIFIAICSRNDSKTVESAIEELDENIFPLKNQIDLVIANNNDKSENIKILAEELSILPSSIVFIDDNQLIRDEVKQKMSSVFVPDWENHFDLITKLKVGCIFDRNELSLNSQNRRKQYKIIETERKNNSLPILAINKFCDNDHTESIKLYSKSNQFKLSLNDENFDLDTKSNYFELCRDNGETLGICSAITFNNASETLILHNWAISCRYFNIGLEEFILLFIQKMTNSKKIFIKYQKSEYNQKVNELLNKYPEGFIIHNSEEIIEINFTKEFVENITRNTNLRII